MGRRLDEKARPAVDVARPGTGPRKLLRRRRLVAGSLLLVVLGTGAWAVAHLARASGAAHRGQAALIRAEHELQARQIAPARADLALGRTDFERVRAEMRGLGPIVPAVRALPILGDSVRAVDDLTVIGLRLCAAGSDLAATAGGVLSLQSAPHPSPEEALQALKSAEASIGSGLKTLDAAQLVANKLAHFHLVGTLARARAQLSSTLPNVRAKAQSTESGLAAAITFAGGYGAKSYLVLSQNPDELRPTGGYLGTYGVITADNGHLALTRYASIESWWQPRPGVVVAQDQRQGVFAVDPRLPQTIADVNDSPNWSRAGQLAAQLWQRGGEQPVNGVVSFTPDLLVKFLGVVGPVVVPQYGQTVTQANAVALMNYYTHTLAGLLKADRKDFVADLAKELMAQLLATQPSKWQALGEVIASSFRYRAAMAWSSDPEVQGELARLRWDGDLAPTQGDFFQETEFEYAAKNGSFLRRSFQHSVELHADGSARVTTTMTITNTATPDQDKLGDLSYITFYGPGGAQAVRPGTDSMIEAATVNGHPAQAGFITVNPGQTATVTAVWDAPRVATQDGSTWTYNLDWQATTSHGTDVLTVTVSLPGHAQWPSGRGSSLIVLDRPTIQEHWSYTTR